MVKKYTVTLDESVVDGARKKLEIGQKLSPVINQLLKEWVKLKEEEE